MRVRLGRHHGRCAMTAVRRVLTKDRVEHTDVRPVGVRRRSMIQIRVLSVHTVRESANRSSPRTTTRPAMLEIDFSKIRSFGKSQYAAFEELCCQLAWLEVRGRGGQFYRKGSGADAGVECYVARADGGETGWQAKYFDKFDTGQANNLTESLTTALRKHPKLDHYVVCLSLNLRDARLDGQTKTELERFTDWRKARIAAAKALGRKLEIEFWGASEITERLGRDDPLYSGRAVYWFDLQVLTSAWFERHFQAAKRNLGSRYTPDSSVELPIRQALAAMSRDQTLIDEHAAWPDRLRLKQHGAVAAVESLAEDAATALSSAVGDLVDALTVPFPIASEHVPTETWTALIDRALDATDSAFKAIAPPADKPADAHRDQARKLYSLVEALRDIRIALAGRAWTYVNTRQLLLRGPAGAGKSHLLAEFVEGQIGAGAPAVLVLSNTLTNGEPWSQILSELDLAGTRVEHFLGMLDAAAQAHGVRAVVAIDALNERSGLDLWPDRLPGFLSAFNRFAHVSVVVSARSTYLRALGLDRPEKIGLAALDHPGFGEDGGDAAELYLERRGIAPFGAPVLDPAFENPLFLKTCCDYLLETGQKAFPKGLSGLTAIAEFYFAAVAEAVLRRLGLSPLMDAPRRALDAFTDAIVEAGDGYLPLRSTIALFEDVHASGGRQEHSLLDQFISEGVLSLERDRLPGGGHQDNVRFTFERFSDHAIARRLLDRHLDLTDVDGSFARGPLHEALFGAPALRRWGVVEALANQVPERTGREIVDLAPAKGSSNAYDWAIHEARLWRDPDAFTDRTLDILVGSGPLGVEAPWQYLIEVAVEPRNRLNAEALDTRLRALNMPDRDRDWSIYLAEEDVHDGALGALIGWSRGRGARVIDAERARLAAIALTWCLTTSNRGVRDLATKGLANVLVGRADLAASLVRNFVGVDDPYLVERLLAGVLGGLTQGATPEAAGIVAKAVWENVFEPSPPAHLMIRDHAAAIIDYAEIRGGLPSEVDVARCHPPYASTWPLETVSDEQMAAFKRPLRGGGNHRDEIVSSTADGDFQSYVIRYALTAFSPFGLEDAGKDAEKLYDEWSDAFHERATPTQKVAFTALLITANKSREVSSAYYQRRWKALPKPPIYDPEIDDEDFDDRDLDAGDMIDDDLDDDETLATPSIALDLVNPPAMASLDEAEDTDTDDPFPVSDEDMVKIKAVIAALQAIPEPGDDDGEATKAAAEAARDLAKSTFEATLSADEVTTFRMRAWPTLTERGDRLKRPADITPLSGAEAARWIAWRAHDLGWTVARFQSWEDGGSIGRGRMGDSRVERVGKKYQWIALNELVGRLADRFALVEDDGLFAYRGGWDSRLRQIDPSLLLSQTPEDGWSFTTSTWWSPPAPKLGPASVDERLAWLDSELGPIGTEASIEAVDPETGRRWLVLSGYYRWGHNRVVDGERYDDRAVGWSVSCLVTRKRDAAKLQAALSGAKVRRNHDIPTYEGLEVRILGEYPWRGPAAGLGEDWFRWDDLGGAPVRPTTVDFLAETGTYDNSIDETINLRLPAPWLVRVMDLTFLGGDDAAYGKDGKVLVMDPTARQSGSSAALVDAEAFEAMLEREKLAAVWVMTGERRVLGVGRNDRGWGGSRDYSIILRRLKSGWKRSEYIKKSLPRPSQLRDLRKEER